MSKIAPLSGFPELLPVQRAVEREVIASVSRTFELHGFTNIETRVVEPIDRLAKGGEVDKEIYVLQRIAAEPDARAELGLHFDLTVPFDGLLVQAAQQVDLLGGLPLLQQLVERLDGTGLDAGEAVQLEGGAQHVDDLLLDRPVLGQELGEPAQRADGRGLAHGVLTVLG